MSAYSVGEAARILKVSPSRLRRWGREELLPGTAAGERRAFAFRDLVSARSMLELLEGGVPLRRIRRSLEALRHSAPEIERPLDHLRLWRAGSKRVVVRHGGVCMEPEGQTVLDFVGPEARPSPVAPLDAGGPAAAAPGTPLASSASAASAEPWFERGCRLDADPATQGEAIEAYLRALEIDPELADAHTNLGAIYFNQERWAAARRSFERALELQPNHVEANLNYAMLLEECGRHAAALRHYRRALAVDPLFADAHVSLALLYERLALKGQARSHWRRYLQLDPRGAWSEVARRRLGADA